MDCKVAFWVSVSPTSEKLDSGDADGLNYQDSRGQLISAWNTLSIRVIDLDLTADVSKLVAIGLVHQPSATSDPSPSPSAQARLLEASAGVTPSPSTGASQSSRMERRIAVYDIESRQELWCVTLSCTPSPQLTNPAYADQITIGRALYGVNLLASKFQTRSVWH